MISPKICHCIHYRNMSKYVTVSTTNTWDTKYVTVSNTWAIKYTVTSYFTKYALCSGVIHCFGDTNTCSNRFGQGGRQCRLSGRPVVPLPDTECADQPGSFLGETRPQTVVCCLVCEEPPFCLRSYKRPFRVWFGTSLLYVSCHIARKSTE